MDGDAQKARQDQMKKLNRQFSSWIEAETQRDPTGILINACEDYISHCQRITGTDDAAAQHRAPTSAGPAAARATPASPASFNLPASSQPGSHFAPFGSSPAPSSAAAPSFTSGPQPSAGSGEPAAAPAASASTPASLQPGSAPSLFGASSSAAFKPQPGTGLPPLFGASQGTNSLFGAPQSQPASSAPSLFGNLGNGKFSFGAPAPPASSGPAALAGLNGGSTFGFGLGASSAAAAASPAPAEEGDEDEGPREVAGEVVIDGSSELLFKAVASLSFQQAGAWKSRGQGVMTVRRDTSKGLDSPTSFVVFTTESGRILLSSGLNPQSQAKETARQTTRILGVHLEGKFQMALLKFKSANEADAFAKHVQEHRPKA